LPVVATVTTGMTFAMITPPPDLQDRFIYSTTKNISDDDDDDDDVDKPNCSLD
jgi:hypothetical protein